MISYNKPAFTFLTSVSAAVTLLTISQTGAQVVFDDGKMHTISDDSYASKRIELRNGSKLKIKAGAEIAASLGPNNESAIQVFDRSMLIVQEGDFGADGSAFSGTIAAYDDSKVHIQSGNFGKSGFRSGMLLLNDNAQLSISGGTFTNDGGSGGRIELYDHAEANISGGHFGASIRPTDHSTLRISGGMFGKDSPTPIFGGRPWFFRGSIWATGSANVKISGGEFGFGTGWVIFSGALFVQDVANLKISGGTFKGDPVWGNGLVILQSPAATARISGGWFDGTEINVEAGLAEIEGSAFNLPFGPVEALSAPLLGTLENGDSIDVTLTRADSPDAVIELIED